MSVDALLIGIVSTVILLYIVTRLAGAADSIEPDEEEQPPQRPELTTEQQLVWARIYQAKAEYYRTALLVTPGDLENWTWETYLKLNGAERVENVKESKEVL